MKSSTRIVVASKKYDVCHVWLVASALACSHLILLYRNQSRRQKVIAGSQSVPSLPLQPTNQPPTDAIPLVTRHRQRRHDQNCYASEVGPLREKPQNATDAAVILAIPIDDDLPQGCWSMVVGGSRERVVLDEDISVPGMQTSTKRI